MMTSCYHIVQSICYIALSSDFGIMNEYSPIIGCAILIILSQIIMICKLMSAYSSLDTISTIWNVSLSKFVKFILIQDLFFILMNGIFMIILFMQYEKFSIYIFSALYISSILFHCFFQIINYKLREHLISLDDTFIEDNFFPEIR